MATDPLPTGTVSFLLTDIQGSTRLWETVPEAMEVALDRHNRLLADVIGAHGGVVVTSRGEGDSFFAAFPSAVAAVEAAAACQLRLHSEPWPPGAVLLVRMGLHTGEAQAADGDYVDHTTINRCARVKTAAHGGQVLVTQATRDLVQDRLSGGLSLTRLGSFRLRDLARPEPLYQLTHPDLPQEYPPIRTSAAQVGNLPLEVSSFVGRGRELDEAAQALVQARVVTLTGPGGVGKTRLAVHVAGQVQASYGTGAWLCELAPVREDAGVDDAVAAVFSVTARADQTTSEALADYLRSKQVLLVLDNCEHVLAPAATLAAQLVGSCPDLAILATSREALGIAGERLIPVPPLGVPTVDADLRTTTRAEAVRLFAERAAAVKPQFRVTADNAAAVAAIVRRLDGVALAIELAAARTPTMTPAELARRLQRSFALLTTGLRTAVDRHQTLRATIDWSFELLTQPEQRLLCRLAVFAGDWSLDAAEGICGQDGIDSDEVLELLASLVAQSLVVAHDDGAQTRYRLLETIRQYGEERLSEADELELWRTRHAHYYADGLHLARQPDPQDAVFWAVRLAAEQDELLAAWAWAIRSSSVDVAFKILAGFAPCEVWSTYLLFLPGEQALDLPGAAEHPGYPLAAAVSALFASHRADVLGSQALCERALEANARQAAPDWRVDESVLAAQFNIAMVRGDFTQAAVLAERAARIAQAGGDLADASVQLATAVAFHVLADDGPSGVPLSHEALALARQVGGPALIATALLEVGAAVVGTDPDLARSCLRESRELRESIGYSQSRDLVWAAGIAMLLADVAQTVELSHAALLGLEGSGDRLLMGITLHILAGALSATRPEVAATLLGAAEAHVIEVERTAQLVTMVGATTVGEERVRKLRASGAAMAWDQVVAYALRETTAHP